VTGSDFNWFRPPQITLKPASVKKKCVPGTLSDSSVVELHVRLRIRNESAAGNRFVASAQRPGPGLEATVEDRDYVVPEVAK
jgi:hypothetical protein